MSKKNQVQLLSNDVQKLIGSATVKIPLSELDSLRAKCINAEARAVEAESKMGKVEVTTRTINGEFTNENIYQGREIGWRVVNEVVWGNKPASQVVLINMEEAKSDLKKYLESNYNLALKEKREEYENWKRAINSDHLEQVDSLKKEIEKGMKLLDSLQDELIEVKTELAEEKKKDKDLVQAVKEYKNDLDQVSIENTRLEMICDKMKKELSDQSFIGKLVRKL